MDLAALDHGVPTPDPLRGRVKGLGAVEHQELGLARVQAPRLQTLQQRHTDRGVLGRALTQAEDALGAIGGDPRRNDHRLAGVLDAIDHDHREVHAVETAFSQGRARPDAGSSGPAIGWCGR
jgi:hypothetical protein